MYRRRVWIGPLGPLEVALSRQQRATLGGFVRGVLFVVLVAAVQTGLEAVEEGPLQQGQPRHSGRPVQEADAGMRRREQAVNPHAHQQRRTRILYQRHGALRLLRLAGKPEVDPDRRDGPGRRTSLSAARN
jgi:hypothetical protein